MGVVVDVGGGGLGDGVVVGSGVPVGMSEGL